MTPPVTAIVVSYHTGRALRECLYVLASDPEIDAVLIVDNGNPEDDTAWLRNFAGARKAVALIEPQRNLGFGAAINLAARDADEGFLLIINPDAVLKRGSVGAMVKVGEQLAPPWIVGGKVFNMQGREERGPRRRKLTLWRALASFAGLNLWTLEKKPAPKVPVRMGAVSGALMLTSTASFARLEGFDEGYFLHVEDVDLCRRAWEAGGEVIYCPSAGALHYGSTSDAPSEVVAGYKADSLNRYFRKFASNPVERAAAALAAPVIRSAVLRRARR